MIFKRLALHAVALRLDELERQIEQLKAAIEGEEEPRRVTDDAAPHKPGYPRNIPPSNL